MADTLTEKGREGFLDGTLDWDTNSYKAILLDLDTTDAAVKAVTAASNATPIVLTSAGHGYSNGDIVVVGKVLGNLAANGLWKIANVAANTMELTDPVTAGNVVGSAAYTSGGYVVCLGPSTSGDNLDDFDGCRIGTDVALTSPTVTRGVAGAANPTWTTVSGATIEAIGIYKDTGTPSTSRMATFIDGRQIVVCAATAAGSATSIPVERLRAAIANGSVLAFSNGQTATLTAQANAGDRTLTVSALGGSVTAGSRADAACLNAGLPFTPVGGNISWVIPATGIFVL